MAKKSAKLDEESWKEIERDGENVLRNRDK